MVIAHFAFSQRNMHLALSSHSNFHSLIVHSCLGNRVAGFNFGSTLVADWVYWDIMQPNCCFNLSCVAMKCVLLQVCNSTTNRTQLQQQILFTTAPLLHSNIHSVVVV